jgi:tRNA1Val (adenine37-N6)-methyltransferase
MNRETVVRRETDAGTVKETLDALFDGRLKLLQSRSGYRVSIDPLLLAYFVSVKRGQKIVDLGTGNGVICLALAHLYPSASLTGIEIQTSLAERAVHNVRLNGLEGRIKIIPGDVRGREYSLKPGSFDVAVCNPPYRRPSSGRVSVNDEKRIARHELNGDLVGFLRAGAFLLRDKGHMALVYLAGRSADLIVAMRQAGIEPKRLRMVHSFAEAEASLILLEGVKGGKAGLAVLPPLVIYRRGKKDYTNEVAAMINGKPR